MSIFGDGVDDILNSSFHDDPDQLPDAGDDNEEIFGDAEHADEKQEGGQTAVATKVQPKKRNVNARPRLNVEVLRGPRGLHTIEDYFSDIQFKGKGREKEDLDEVMRRLQHWGHRMYPTYKFDDVLTNIERLGKKKPLQVHMSRYRLGMLESMKNHNEVNDADDDDEDQPAVAADEPYDEFDALLDEQIAISKIDPRTPGPSTSRNAGALTGHTNTSISSSNFDTPSFSRGNAVISTPYTGHSNVNDTSDLAIPLPPSQPSTPAPKKQLNSEQMARIAENRRLAQERLAAKKRQHQVAPQIKEIVQT